MAAIAEGAGGWRSRREASALRQPQVAGLLKVRGTESRPGSRGPLEEGVEQSGG